MCHRHTQSLTYGTGPSCPGCRSVWGRGATSFGEGVPGLSQWQRAQAQLRLWKSQSPPALSFPHQQPTASLTLHSGFVLEREAWGGSHRENSTWGSSTSGQVSGAAAHLFFFFPPTSLSSPFNFSISFPNGSLGDSQPRAAPKGGLTPSPPSQVRSATERAPAPLPSLGTGNVPSPPVLRPLSTDPCVFPSAS